MNALVELGISPTRKSPRQNRTALYATRRAKNGRVSFRAHGEEELGGFAFEFFFVNRFFVVEAERLDGFGEDHQLLALRTILTCPFLHR